MILEIVLAWFDNLTPFFFTVGVAAIVASIFGIAITNEDTSSEKEVEMGVRLIRTFIPTAIICIVFATVPSAENLWKVRVGLLKLELSSPENVKAVGGHVEEIVKALECKHLNVNCPEKKESK